MEELNIDFDKIYSQMPPEEQKRLNADWAEVLLDELPRLAVEEPNTLEQIIARLGEKVTPEERAKLIRILAGQEKPIAATDQTGQKQE